MAALPWQPQRMPIYIHVRANSLLKNETKKKQVKNVLERSAGVVHTTGHLYKPHGVFP